MRKYLRNLDKITRKNVVLSDDVKEYLQSVYDACSMYTRKKDEWNLRSAINIDTMVDTMKDISYSKKFFIPFYTDDLKRMLEKEYNITKIYAHAAENWKYITDDEADVYIPNGFVSKPTKILEDAASNDYFYIRSLYPIKNPEKSFAKVFKITLAMIRKYIIEIHAIDLFTNGEVSGIIQDMLEYMINVDALFRYIATYNISGKYSASKVSTTSRYNKIVNKYLNKRPECEFSVDKYFMLRVNEVVTEYQKSLMHHMIYLIEIIAAHNDINVIPESIDGNEIMRFIRGQQKNASTGHLYTYLNNVMSVKVCDSLGNIHESMVGSYQPELYPSKTRSKELCESIKEIYNEVYDIAKIYNRHVPASNLYNRICKIADDSYNEMLDTKGFIYFKVSHMLKVDIGYVLEQNEIPTFHLDKAVRPVTSKTDRSKTMERHMNTYRRKETERNTTLNPIVSEGISHVPYKYTVMDMKDIYDAETGKSYKFKNEAIWDRLTDADRGLMYRKKPELIMYDGDSTLGFEEYDMYNKNPGGDIDRSSWEPRRNNWTLTH